MTKPVTVSTSPADGDLQGVVVSVSIEVGALAEDALVLLRSPLRVVIVVRGGELGFTGEIDHCSGSMRRGTKSFYGYLELDATDVGIGSGTVGASAPGDASLFMSSGRLAQERGKSKGNPKKENSESQTRKVGAGIRGRKTLAKLKNVKSQRRKTAIRGIQ